MLEQRGFIYVQGPGTDPTVDRVVIEQGGLRTTIVAVPNQSEAVRVAAELVDRGAQCVELYDSLGPIWIGHAMCRTPGLESAIGLALPQVPVGSS